MTTAPKSKDMIAYEQQIEKDKIQLAERLKQPNVFSLLDVCPYKYIYLFMRACARGRGTPCVPNPPPFLLCSLPGWRTNG